jgi:hypothetical protein
MFKVHLGDTQNSLTEDDFVRISAEHLYNIQCSEIFTLRNEKLHTEP